MRGTEQVADGLWRLRGGFPLSINVFFVAEEDGVAVFDAGTKAMGPAIRAAADELGGATRVILGNAHPDHRGGANAVGAPVWCGEAERSDVAGDGGLHYFDFAKLPALNRPLSRYLMRSWDGGPVKVSGTLLEGDPVGEFGVMELPGHGPGTIGLLRERDGLALTNDAFALFDPALPRPGRPRIPHPAFNFSTSQVRASLAKLAEFHPTVCWPGHYGPLEGPDLPERLLAAART